MRNTDAQQMIAAMNEQRGGIHEVVTLLSRIARNIDDFRYEMHQLNRYLRKLFSEDQSGA